MCRDIFHAQVCKHFITTHLGLHVACRLHFVCHKYTYKVVARSGPSFDERLACAVHRKTIEMKEMEREQRGHIMVARENGERSVSVISKFTYSAHHDMAFGKGG